MNRAAVRRGLASAAAGLFAFAALFSGFDRAAEGHPGLARLVPGFAANSALRVRAADRLALEGEGHRRAAGVLAARAQRRDPLDPRAVSLLATARGLAGDAGGARDAHRVGALLGWRDTATQIYWLRANLDHGNAAAAALRLDVLLRTASAPDVAQRLLGEFEADPAGRSALAARLAAAPVWGDTYLAAREQGDPVLRARAGFLAGGEAPPLGCAKIEPLVAELAKRGFRREGEALARRQCPALAGERPVADPAFARFNAGRAGPFGWQRTGQGDVRVTPRAQGIEIASSASVSRLVLTQAVDLAPGRYGVVGALEGARADRLVATLGCGAPARPGSARVLVATGCADAVLALWLRPGGGAVKVGRITLQPLSR